MPVAVNGLKECSKCHEVKRESEFHKCARHSDGLQSQCKACQRQGHRGKHKSEYRQGSGYRPAGYKGLALFVFLEAINDARGVHLTPRKTGYFGGPDVLVALVHQWWVMETNVLRDLILDRANIDIRGPELLAWVLDGKG